MTEQPPNIETANEAAHQETATKFSASTERALNAAFAMDIDPRLTQSQHCAAVIFGCLAAAVVHAFHLGQECLEDPATMRQELHRAVDHAWNTELEIVRRRTQ